MVRILVVPLSDCCHIHSCVVKRYCAQYHCLFFAYSGAFSRGLAGGGSHREGPGDLNLSQTTDLFNRKEEAVSPKSLPLKIEPDIYLVCPTSSFFTRASVASESDLCCHLASLGHYELTHWAPVIPYSDKNLVIIGSGNGLSPVCC